MKRYYYTLKYRFNIVRKDIYQKFPLPIWTKSLYWYKGFLAEKHVLYELDLNDYRLYLSDFHAAKTRFINEPYNAILTNKLIFNDVVGSAISVPELYGLIIDGTYHSRSTRGLKEVLMNVDKLVVKPVDGGGGKDVYIVQKTEDYFCVNAHKKFTLLDLERFILGLNDFIVTEYIESSDWARGLNPDTINTMRVVTAWDKETNKPFIVRAVQRIGVKSSAPMDNFTRGGLSANIDLTTGELSDATSHPVTRTHKRYEIHPESNVNIKGQVVPNWIQISEEIVECARNLPMLRYIGWDFLLGSNGLVALEGNHHPDPDVIQCHGALLNDKRLVNFFESYKII